MSTIQSASGLATTTPPPIPTRPAAPTLVSNGSQGSIVGNMDAAHLVDLFPATLTQASSSQIVASGAGGLGFTLKGSGFTYSDNVLIAGHGSHLTFTDVANGATVLQLDVSLAQVDVGSFQYWLAYDQTQQAFGSILAGNDKLAGASHADLIRSFSGNDLIAGGGGDDSLWGGDGNDVIYAGFAPGTSGTAVAGTTWLRGEAGDDYIVGGAGFDNVNGNLGADTIDGGAGGGDWLLGGQGDDMIFAHAGDSIINGNLGDDSIVGGAGHDSLRGGQGNDVIWAGSGGDWITGDRGADTIVAGQGADTIYVFQGSGGDRVFSFDAAHDHIQMAAGMTYSLSQVGADVLVDFGQGDSVTLADVQMSALPAGWIAT
jgi:Ca2+-binding RTX toxin-like protein